MTSDTSSVAVESPPPNTVTAPTWLITADGVSSGAVRLYLAYMTMMDGTGRCAPTAATLCQMLKISTATFYRQRSELERVGALLVHRTDPSSP